ncbi:MAG: hypothetical protein PHU01_09240, partial [Desulfuromonadaceae bacterium]|nr:hypothetical protein [Desulfuromonadaceae bacterium]
MSLYRSYFETKYGSGYVCATELGVVKVEIPDLASGNQLHIVSLSDSEQSEITIKAAMHLKSYFNGDRVDFTDIPVSLDGLTSFRQKVLIAARNVKYGEICSYGHLAELCHFSRA